MLIKTYFDEWQAVLPVLVLASGLVATALGTFFQETPEVTAIAVALVAIF